MNILIHAVGILLLWAGFGAISLLAIDAYEYEITGECTDCLLLPYLNSQLSHS